MRVADFKIGMRVRKRGAGSSFVQDRNPAFRPRRVGIVVALPVRSTERHHVASIQWEGSSRVDEVPIHRLEPAPPAQAAGEAGVPAA